MQILGVQQMYENFGLTTMYENFGRTINVCTFWAYNKCIHILRIQQMYAHLGVQKCMHILRIQQICAHFGRTTNVCKFLRQSMP
jgi:hypothetical protein